MSGVIDNNGVQWERCNHCGEWVRIEQLGYQKPSDIWEHGRDLCIECTDTLIRKLEIAFEDITPGQDWVATEVAA